MESGDAGAGLALLCALMCVPGILGIFLGFVLGRRYVALGKLSA